MKKLMTKLIASSLLMLSCSALASQPNHVSPPRLPPLLLPGQPNQPTQPTQPTQPRQPTQPGQQPQDPNQCMPGNPTRLPQCPTASR